MQFICCSQTLWRPRDPKLIWIDIIYTLFFILVKFLEELVLQTIKDNTPASLEPHQYELKSNVSTEDAVSTAVHSVFTHPESNEADFQDGE